MPRSKAKARAKAALFERAPSPSIYSAPGTCHSFEQMMHVQLEFDDWVTRTSEEYAISKDDASAWLAEMEDSTAIHWSQSTSWRQSNFKSDIHPNLNRIDVVREGPKEYNWPPPQFHLLRKKLIVWCPVKKDYVKVEKKPAEPED